MSGGTVLVVDDSPTVCGRFRQVLEGAGYAVDTAEDGESALAACREISYDLVFLDLVLPGANGIAVYKRMREFHQKPVVVLMTAYAEEMKELLDEAWQLGLMKSFLRKPVTDEEILRVAKQLIGNVRGRLKT